MLACSWESYLLVDKFSASLGTRLRAARRQRGWSLGEIEAFTEGQFKASVVGAYERGERAISVHRFVRLAEVYGVPAGDLLPIITDSDSVVIDLDALAAGGSDNLAERYLAAIQLLRREAGTNEVRDSDKVVLATLMEASVEPDTDRST